MTTTHAYLESVHSGDDRGEYDDAFDEAQADCADGFNRNDYEKGSLRCLGYKAGIKAF